MLEIVHWHWHWLLVYWWSDAIELLHLSICSSNRTHHATMCTLGQHGHDHVRVTFEILIPIFPDINGQYVYPLVVPVTVNASLVIVLFADDDDDGASANVTMTMRWPMTMTMWTISALDRSMAIVVERANDANMAMALMVCEADAMDMAHNDDGGSAADAK